jgi:kumamolisin
MGMGTSDGTAEFARVEGSDRKPLPDAERIGGIDRKRQMDVTVVMRRKSGGAVQAATPPAPRGDIAGWRRDLRQRLAADAGADTTELDAVTSYLTSRGLSIEAADAGQRRIVVRGDVDQMEAAFNVELDLYQAGDIRYRGREGHVHLPADIADYVEAVLGLDDRPQARIHMKRGPALDESVLPHPREDPMARLQARARADADADATPAPTPLWPMQVAQLYDFPADVDGSGQTIGIIELAGGYRDSDLGTYFSQAGLQRPEVIAIPDEANTPGASDADGEVALDIQVAGAIAPGSRIVVYFGTDPDSGFYDALSAAIHDDTNSPSTISISWGAPEKGWTDQGLRVFDQLFEDAAALGITVLAAAGDHGAGDAAMDDEQHADFPASSPNVIACGGTTLIAGPDEKIASEVVWNDGDGWATGGGYSTAFARPDWQSAVPSGEDAIGGRGVPDVSGNADGRSGFFVRLDGDWMQIGGTSAVAPLYAGLFALIGEELGHPPTGMPQALYTAPATTFTDITDGNNSTPATQEYGPAVTGFSAVAGWDACTGLGSIVGTALTTYLQTQQSMTGAETA